jgi:hypothetical protein
MTPQQKDILGWFMIIGSFAVLITMASFFAGMDAEFDRQLEHKQVIIQKGSN